MKRKKILLSAAVAMSLLLSFTACSKQEDKSAMANNDTKTEQQMENKDSDMNKDSEMGEVKFTAKDLDGNEQSEQIFKNSKLTVLNIWGTFCKPCVEEMPELGKLSDEYKDKGVQVVGIVADTVDADFNPMDDMITTAKDMLKTIDVNYVNLLPSKELAEIYLKDIQAFPKTLILDSEGKILREISGSRNLEGFQKEVDEELAKLQ